MEKVIQLVSVLACLALSGLPVMSVFLDGTESCTLIIRGFNLAEFSAWGWLPLIIPLTDVFLKKRSSIILLAAGVGYFWSFFAAASWLHTVGDSAVTYHVGALIYPAAVCLSVIFMRKSELAIFNPDTRSSRFLDIIQTKQGKEGCHEDHIG